MNSIICLKPCFIPCKYKYKVVSPKSCSTKSRTIKFRASPQDSQPPNTQQQQQLNLSVLRFTLGIPGLDESYLPRWIGYAFGSLLLLNHFLGSDSATLTPQLSTEVLGLSLASFSILLPYLGKFLKGAQPVEQTTIPDGTQQIFVMSTDIVDGLKEDLAWTSYILLRNTNALAAIIFIQGDICARGYWNITNDSSSKEMLLGGFREKIENAGLYDLKDTLNFPQDADSEFQDLVPKGTQSLLVQPVLQVSIESATDSQKSVGFILLVSTMRYAFSIKDRAWIAAVANKLREWKAMKE